MKAVFVCCVLAVLAVSQGMAGHGRLWKRQVPTGGELTYDQEIDKILENERLVQHYYKCLVDDTYRCRGDGLKLKKRFPQYLEEGLQTDSETMKKDCKDTSCTAEKKAVKRLVKYFIEERPEMWEKVEEKYDPSGEYKRKYQEKYGLELENSGITLTPSVFSSPAPAQ